MQAADILTKPFTNAQTWKFALALMSHVVSLERASPKKPQLASPSEPQPQALASSRSFGEPRPDFPESYGGDLLQSRLEAERHNTEIS